MTYATVTFTLNGANHVARVPSGQNLLGYVRDEVGLKGSKIGCQSGDCGACTMIADGTVVQTCQMLVAAVDGAEVTTIEGIVADPLGAQIKQALIREGAAQCGYCLPGIVASATGAFARDGQQTDIAAALSRNICRCGTHHRILAALANVRDTLAGDAP